MKKLAKWIVVVVVAIVIIVVAALSFWGGAMVKTAVNVGGPRVLGVPVEVEKVHFRPFSGRLILNRMRVGNPEGFNTPHLFQVATVDVDLDVVSLLSDTIVVRKIEIESPDITYEQGLTGSNFGALLDRLEGEESEKDERVDEEGAKPEPTKTVVIDRLIVADPALNVSLKAAGGKYIPVKLGNVDIEGIGRDEGGVSPVDAVKIFLSVITSNIKNAVAGAGDLVGAGITAAGAGAKAVTKAASDSVESARDAAGEGAEAVGEKVSEGASSVIKGVGGLLGREEKKSEEAEN